MTYIFVAIGCLWIGWLIGWSHAHQTVAGECRKLGGFYVGKSVFKCTEIVGKDVK